MFEREEGGAIVTCRSFAPDALPDAPFLSLPTPFESEVPGRSTARDRQVVLTAVLLTNLTRLAPCSNSRSPTSPEGRRPDPCPPPFRRQATFPARIRLTSPTTLAGPHNRSVLVDAPSVGPPSWFKPIQADRDTRPRLFPRFLPSPLFPSRPPCPVPKAPRNRAIASNTPLPQGRSAKVCRRRGSAQGVWHTAASTPRSLRLHHDRQARCVLHR